MKNISKLVFITLFISLILPNIAFALWWNPFTWFKTKEPSQNITIVSDSSQVFSLWNPSTWFSNKKVQEIRIGDQGSELITEFFKNPTIENFKIICDKAKNIDGNTTKQILDSNREKMITVKQSLYYDEEMINCHYLDDNSGVSFLPLDNSSLIPLQDNDTDKIREEKIIFNDKIKGLILTSKVRFILFSKPADNVSFELFKKNIDKYYRLNGLSGYFK